MRKEQGFSLVEMLIVVAVLGVISALAIPGLQRAKRYAQSGSAIQSLRTITTAETLYHRRYKIYGTLVDLAPEGTVDPNLSVGYKSGYFFTVNLALDANDIAAGKLLTFKCNANPEADPTIATYFYVDETAVIRHREGAPADATSDPIPK